MKKVILFLFVLVMTNICLALDLKVGYVDEALPPFAIGTGSEQPQPPGIYIDLVNETAKILGIKVVYERQPAKRVQLSTEQGYFDAHFSLSYKVEREKIGKYPMKDGKVDGTRRIGAVSYYLYKLEADSIEWDGKKILNVKKEIGANLGFSIAEDIRKMGFAVSETKTTSGNLKKLQLGIICAFAGQDVDTDALIKTGKYGKIVKSKLPLSTKDYFLIFSNQFYEKNFEIAEKLWDVLAEIRDAKTEEFADKYLESQE